MQTRRKWLEMMAGAAGGGVAIGVMCLLSIQTKFGGIQPWIAAIAVGVAILVMLATDTFHPPAGINPLIIVTHSMPWTFILVPVAVGALLLLTFTWFWTNWVRGMVWPQRWL